MRAIFGTPSFRFLCLFVLGYFLIMLLYGLDRHWSFKTSTYDTGVFDQAIWGTLNGKPFLDSVIFSRPVSWLGFHFHPILLLFVPLYFLAAAPEWLIAAQALAISLTAFPIYLTAIKLNYAGRQALLWAAGFLLNPFVISAAIWDFHPVALAAPLISMSILFLLGDQYNKLLVCVAILLLCQEQMGLVVLCIGISYYLINRHTLKSLTLILIGLVSTAFLFAYWFPSMSPTGDHIMVTSNDKSLNRYHWIGSSFSSIIYNVLTHPFSIAKFCLIEMKGYLYLLYLFFPYGTVLPLIGYEILIIGAADFAANLLSLNMLPRSLASYHSLTLIPVILTAAMLGLKRIEKKPRFGQFLPIRIFFVRAFTIASFATLFMVSAPHLLGNKSLWALKLSPSKDKLFAEIQSKIPKNAALSAQSNLGAHFSQRINLFAYPNKANEADFVILKIPHLDHPVKHDDFLFTHHMLLSPKDYLSSIRCLLHDGLHAIFYFKEPWLVFSKTSHTPTDVNLESVHSYLNKLEERWQLEKSQPNPKQCSWPT